MQPQAALQAHELPTVTGAQRAPSLCSNVRHRPRYKALELVSPSSVLPPRGAQVKTLLGLSIGPCAVALGQKPRAKQPKPRAEPPPKKRRKWKEFSSTLSGSSAEDGGDDDGGETFLPLSIYVNLARRRDGSPLWDAVVQSLLVLGIKPLTLAALK